MDTVKTYEELLAAGDFIVNQYGNEFWDNWDECQKLIEESKEKLYVYTVIDGEGNSCWIVEGKHWANRLGYLFSKKYVPIEDYEIMW